MSKIHLTTFIQAPAERVFDLTRSIELHRKSMSQASEQAVAGTTTGLIGFDETVTWKAKHFFRTRILKVRITSMSRPLSFTDEMVAGDFKELKHEHHFKQVDNGTLMIDLLHFEMPFGGLGQLADRFMLRRYLKKLLERRIQFIREYAESERWKFILTV